MQRGRREGSKEQPRAVASDGKERGRAYFQMRQCGRDACRFRFPAPATTGTATPAEVRCPECGAETRYVSEPFAGREPGAAPAASLPVEALLDNIRSIFNVGSMFRTADGAGIRHLHLAGITATPEHPKVAKTALGAEATVPWSRYRNGVQAASALREQGHQLWALESSEQSQNLFAVEPKPSEGPIVLVVGNELAGVDPGIMALCHRTVHLPMEGIKGSLNVAIAFGIAAYYLRYGLR